MSDKLVPIDGKGMKESVEAARKMAENLPLMLELQDIMAKLQYAKYSALVKEGFSRDEALKLCKDVLGQST